MAINAFSLRLPTAAAVAVTAALLATPGIAQLHLPQAVIGTVERSDGAVTPDELRWSAWPADDGERLVSGVALASGAFVGDLGAGMPAAGTGADAGQPWVALVEGDVDGRASFAITRTTVASHPATFPAAMLVAMPVPGSSVEGSDVTLTWQAAELDDPAGGAGRALGPDDGLVAYAVLRSGSGLRGDWQELGRVPAGEGEHSFIDEDLPIGRYHYALAIVAAGGVRSETQVAAGTVTIGLDDLFRRLRSLNPEDRLRPILDGRRER